MTRALRYAIAAALAGAFGLQPSTLGLAAARQQQPPIRVGTTLVTVDVYPTRDGIPVEGLSKDDFELREDGRIQTIDTFEFVRFDPGATEEEIRDPNNQREMLARIADPRSRLFVVFLDTPHVGTFESHRSRTPLVTMLRRTLSAADLFGVMTPDADVRTLAFARGTGTIEAALTKYWEWGDASKPYLDEVETLLENCYASTPAVSILEELYARRREDRVLQALEDLIAHLDGLREGRKVVFIFGNGWRLFEQSDAIPTALARLGAAGVRPPVGVIPGSGRLGMVTDIRDGSLFACNAEANRLAELRHGQRFRDLLRAAAQANVAFYPVHLSGVGGNSRGMDQFRVLASETDGQAVFNTNDLAGGLERVTRPLMAYYLLGYTPTNANADGRPRRIEVRVKQSGVQVLARRGYRALAGEERASIPADPRPPSPFETAVSTAVARLAQIHEGVHMYVHGVAASPDGTSARLWVAGELTPSVARDWVKGGTIELTIGSAPDPVTAAATLAPGVRVWTADVPLSELPDANLPIRARLTAPGRAAPLSGSGALHGERPEALLFRRGPVTGNRYEPAADRRFSRTERVRLDVPAGPAGRAGEARLLDVNGNVLAVPVPVDERLDQEAGVKWVAAELVLAPLGAGDYVVQIDIEGPAGTRSVFTAIRVTR